jgi:hypothetical protein
LLKSEATGNIAEDHTARGLIRKNVAQHSITASQCGSRVSNRGGRPEANRRAQRDNRRESNDLAPGQFAVADRHEQLKREAGSI